MIQVLETTIAEQQGAAPAMIATVWSVKSDVNL